MRLEQFVKHEPHDSRHEQWRSSVRKGHWYEASTGFALKHLKGPGSCLVIGSPLHEAAALEQSWSVTYLDVRTPPREFSRFVLADATNIPLPDKSFDAVSSSCVLCHAGLGRYGDQEVEDGDEKMLKEIARVLKPGSHAALTFGGVLEAEMPIRVGNYHRIYTVKEAKRLCDLAGLKAKETAIWSTEKQCWVDKPTTDYKHFDYLSMYVVAAEQG